MRYEPNLKPTFEETLKRERGMVYTCDMSDAMLNRLAHHENVLKALEKQIPQKPALDDDGCWVCPSCGESYEIEYCEIDYCPVCGQAIDWSDDDD